MFVFMRDLIKPLKPVEIAGPGTGNQRNMDICIEVTIGFARISNCVKETLLFRLVQVSIKLFYWLHLICYIKVIYCTDEPERKNHLIT